MYYPASVLSTGRLLYFTLILLYYLYMEEPEGKIRITENGPYIVTGKIPLKRYVIGIDDEGYSYEWREVEAYPLMDSYALCRCGQSGSKPFCDGTHALVNFEGTETASRKPYLEQAETTEGPALKLTDVLGLCASARFCNRAGGTWELTRKSDDPEARKTAIEEAAACSSGRLVVWDENGQAIEPDLEPSIAITEDPQYGMNGPIWVRGGIPIESADGSLYESRNRVPLCRCGRSRNKPFCDSSHCQKP